MLKGFWRRREGSVSIIGALTLPVLVGFVALTADFGQALVVKVENQRTADMAAFAGALAYGATSSTTTMTATAQNVAALNGVAASAVTASLVTSPRSATSQAVLVAVSTRDVLLLAPLLGTGRTIPVNAKSYAQFGAAPAACILALSSSGSGVTLQGGTAIAAPACTVASNTTVSVPCGTSLTAKAVAYNGAVPSQSCSGITGTITKAATADPLVANMGVLSLSAHATAVAGLAAPAAPSVRTGTDFVFGYNLIGASLTTVTALTSQACIALLVAGTWTVTCPFGSTISIGNITVQGGVSVNFNTAAAAGTTYNISGSVVNSGTALRFGAGTFNIAQGIVTGGGATTSFGAGAFTIGASPSSCNGAGRYSLCNTGTMTFGGPSTFVLSAGLYNAGGSTLTLGSGTTNSFSIGPASDGNAVWIGGGATTTFADATGAGDLFQLVGNYTQSGGACTTISAATQHDFAGNVTTMGGTLLGAGTYTASGSIGIGPQGGGDVTCSGSTIGVSGTNVTLVTAGLSTIVGGSCNGMAFCIGAGFNNVTLSAPTSGTNQSLVIVGPTSSLYSGGISFTEGAANTSLSGAIYFPYGPLTLSGGASVGNQSGQCLQIVASLVALTGGTRASASSCFAASGSSAGASLVQ